MSEDWLKSISGPNDDGLASVKKAQLHYNTKRQDPSLAKEIQFLSKFPTLREIMVTSLPKHWYYIADPSTKCGYRSAMAVDYTGSAQVKKFGPTMLQSCKALQTVRFILPYYIESDLEGKHITGAGVYVNRAAKWLKDDFMKSQSRTLQVELVDFNQQGDYFKRSIGNGSVDPLLWEYPKAHNSTAIGNGSA